MQTERLELVATDLVVTLDEIKSHLIVEHDEDDLIITRYVVAAIAFAETRLERTLRLRRYKAMGTCWPVQSGRHMFDLSHGPVRRIEAVEYFDSNRETQSIPAEQWQVVAHNGGHRFNFIDTPPAGNQTQLDAVSVTYLSGYGKQPEDEPNSIGFPYTLPIVLGGLSGSAQSDVNDRMPDNIRQAIYMLVAHWYENREAVAVGTINSKIALAAEDLLHQERVLGL